MATLSVTRTSSFDEVVAEMDRRGAVIERLEAENERLQGALSEIASAWTAHGYSDAMDAIQCMKDAAKAALKPSAA